MVHDPLTNFWKKKSTRCTWLYLCVKAVAANLYKRWYGTNKTRRNYLKKIQRKQEYKEDYVAISSIQIHGLQAVH